MGGAILESCEEHGNTIYFTCDDCPACKEKVKDQYFFNQMEISYKLMKKAVGRGYDSMWSEFMDYFKRKPK